MKNLIFSLKQIFILFIFLLFLVMSFGFFAQSLITIFSDEPVFQKNEAVYGQSLQKKFESGSFKSLPMSWDIFSLKKIKTQTKWNEYLFNTFPDFLWDYSVQYPKAYQLLKISRLLNIFAVMVLLFFLGVFFRFGFFVPAIVALFWPVFLSMLQKQSSLSNESFILIFLGLFFIAVLLCGRFLKSYIFFTLVCIFGILNLTLSPFFLPCFLLFFIVYFLDLFLQFKNIKLVLLRILLMIVLGLCFYFVLGLNMFEYVQESFLILKVKMKPLYAFSPSWVPLLRFENFPLYFALILSLPVFVIKEKKRHISFLFSFLTLLVFFGFLTFFPKNELIYLMALFWSLLLCLYFIFLVKNEFQKSILFLFVLVLFGAHLGVLGSPLSNLKKIEWASLKDLKSLQKKSKVDQFFSDLSQYYYDLVIVDVHLRPHLKDGLIASETLYVFDSLSESPAELSQRVKTRLSDIQKPRVAFMMGCSSASENPGAPSFIWGELLKEVCDTKESLDIKAIGFKNGTSVKNFFFTENEAYFKFMQDVENNKEAFYPFLKDSVSFRYFQGALLGAQTQTLEGDLYEDLYFDQPDEFFDEKAPFEIIKNGVYFYHFYSKSDQLNLRMHFTQKCHDQMVKLNFKVLNDEVVFEKEETLHPDEVKWFELNVAHFKKKSILRFEFQIEGLTEKKDCSLAVGPLEVLEVRK